MKTIKSSHDALNLGVIVGFDVAVSIEFAIMASGYSHHAFVFPIQTHILQSNSDEFSCHGGEGSVFGFREFGCKGFNFLNERVFDAE